MKSHFEDEERLRGKYIFVKLHFAGRDFRERRETSGKKDFGQIHIVKSHFEDEERLRKQ